MAALWWNSQHRRVGGEIVGLGDFNLAIESALKQTGFKNVTLDPLEISGGKNGCWISIAHLLISYGLYWEVVICSSDDAEKAKSTVEEVVNMLNNLSFV